MQVSTFRGAVVAALCLLSALVQAGDKPTTTQQAAELKLIPQTHSQNGAMRFGPELALCSKGVRLMWHSESGIREVILERSRNGKDFEALLSLETTEKGPDAEFLETDFQPLTGMSYYRIKERHEDGSIRISSASAILVKEGELQLAVRPMPGSETMLAEDKILVLVQDAAGESHCTELFMPEETGFGLINPEHSLPAGDYTIIASSRQKLYSAKLRVKA